MAYRKDYGQPQQGAQGFARTMKCYGRKCNIAVADINLTGNVVGLFVIPANFVVLDMIGPVAPALGAALQVSLGDPGNTARYLAANAFLATGLALPAMAATGPFFTTSLDTEIQMVITTQTASPVAGIFEVYFRGFIL